MRPPIPPPHGTKLLLGPGFGCGGLWYCPTIGLVRYRDYVPPFWAHVFNKATLIGEEEITLFGAAERRRCHVLDVRPPKPPEPEFHATRIRYWIGKGDSHLYRAIGTHAVRGVSVAIDYGPYQVNKGAGNEEIESHRREQARRRALLGRPAPEFSLEDLSEKPFRLSALHGKVVVLDFFEYG